MKPKNVMSPSEIRSLQEEKVEIEATIKELEQGSGDGTRASGIDTNVLKKQVAHLDGKIKAGSPGKIKDLDKDRMAKRAAALEAEFQQGMPTNGDMWPTKGKVLPGIARKNLEWQKRNSGKIAEWRRIMRQLEPGDPTASSIERFRKT